MNSCHYLVVWPRPRPINSKAGGSASGGHTGHTVAGSLTLQQKEICQTDGFGSVSYWKREVVSCTVSGKLGSTLVRRKLVCLIVPFSQAGRFLLSDGSTGFYNIVSNQLWEDIKAWILCHGVSTGILGWVDWDRWNIHDLWNRRGGKKTCCIWAAGLIQPKSKVGSVNMSYWIFDLKSLSDSPAVRRTQARDSSETYRVHAEQEAFEKGGRLSAKKTVPRATA